MVLMIVIIVVLLNNNPYINNQMLYFPNLIQLYWILFAIILQHDQYYYDEIKKLDQNLPYIIIIIIIFCIHTQFQRQYNMKDNNPIEKSCIIKKKNNNNNLSVNRILS